MRNILFVISKLHLIGGEQRSLSLLCNEIAARKDYRITIATFYGEHSVFPFSDATRVIHLQPLAKNRIRRLLHLVEIIRKSDFHLIVGYGAGGKPLPEILPFFVKTPIIYCERVDPSYLKDMSMKGLVKAAIYALSRRRKNIVFQTKAFAKHYKYLNKTAIIPNMLDTNILPDIKDWEKRDYTVINASRSDPTKNHALLIKSFASVHDKYPHYTLEIHSDGTMKQKNIELIEQLGAQSYIKLIPAGQDIFNHLNKAKIYVCSSNMEGYPNTLLEAMAMGMACISTKCSGSVEDLVEDGVNGLLVPVNDVDSMASALIKLMEDEAVAQELATLAASVRVSNSKETIVEKWISFFEEVLEG